mmetsp:Transcript_34836/g.59186  ORF Transcript_34836/g.59186 Transcript_34836/m.59186 type:complete len:271 (-) Transcript_34836:353-1165(-)
MTFSSFSTVAFILLFARDCKGSLLIEMLPAEVVSISLALFVLKCENALFPRICNNFFLLSLTEPCTWSILVHKTSILSPTARCSFTRPILPPGCRSCESVISLTCNSPSLFRSNSMTAPKSLISTTVPSYTPPSSTSHTKSIITLFASYTLEGDPNIRHLPSCDRSRDTSKRSSSWRNTAPPGPIKSRFRLGSNLITSTRGAVLFIEVRGCRSGRVFLHSFSIALSIARLPSLARSSASSKALISSGRFTSNCIAVIPPCVPQILKSISP